MDRPSVDEPSVDMFGVVALPIDMLNSVDHEVLLHYMDEEERRPREERLDGMLLTYYIFQRNFRKT